MPEKRSLFIKGARQNNLKNLNIEIPHHELTVITGPSGSGKSSLAFDTIYAEGQRLYMESLSTYTRQFLERIQRPEMDHIENICPTIAIEQKNRVKNSRATVATSTDIYDYLRLFFSKIGKVSCPKCKVSIQKNSISDIVHETLSKLAGQKIMVIAPFETAGIAKKEFLKTLLQKGLSRILRKEGVMDLHDTVSAPLEPVVKVVLDRLVVKPGIESKLTESLEIAYQETKGKAWIQDEGGKLHKYSIFLKCNECDEKFPDTLPSFFSFNHPYGACTSCNGFGNNLLIDEDLVVPNKNLTLAQGAIDPWTKPSLKQWETRFFEFAKKKRISLDTRYKDLDPGFKKGLFEGTKGFRGIYDFFKRLERKKYKMAVRVFLSRYKSAFICPACCGRRLRAETNFVTIQEKPISAIHAMTVEEAKKFFTSLKLTPFETEASKEILRQITGRLNFLHEVGLDYLTLNRLTRTLSGGEAQRINLGNQLGAQLVETIYVLDEPSIGLHPRDTKRLISTLRHLRDQRNTVIVVEHDPEMIRSSDYVVELGPHGGEKGGNIQFQGPFKEFLNSNTLTSSYLNYREQVPLPKERRKPKDHALKLYGATHHNLKSVDLVLPLNLFICVTGVSGSGKSSLIHETLYNALARIFKTSTDKIGRFKSISGFKSLQGVRLLNQQPIGKSPRSNPVTYMKVYDEIRYIFAAQSESKRRGYTAASFSFNVRGGRCETCEGNGFQKVEMHFLADIYLACELCQGKKFKMEVIQISYRGKNISAILDMTVDEAYNFFLAYTKIRKKLEILQSVGLGYLRLGQSATTLSGGEAQRLKIAKELSVDAKNTLYILDEPTTGLHSDDIKKLLKVLDELVDRGNTIVVIEHNLDVIKTADHVIDLGPGGGERGGSIVGTGTPETIANIPSSFTGQFLRSVLNPIHIDV
jgi:excinuclease ABC subunit A